MDLVGLGHGNAPQPRKPYPSDVTDEEWAFVAPYLTLMTRGRPAAAPRPARGLQRPALDRAHRRAVAVAADQLPALGGRLPADAALAGGRRLRGDGPRPAHAAALERRAAAASRAAVIFDSRTRAVHPGERGRRGLRRAQAAQGPQDAHGRRHARPPAGAARHPGQRAGARAGRGAGRGGAGRRPGRRSSWPSSTRATPASTPRRTPPRTASGWRSSSCRRPSAASCCCPGAGWWSAPSPGWRASAAWRGTTSGCRKRSRGCISSPSPA